MEENSNLNSATLKFLPILPLNAFQTKKAIYLKWKSPTNISPFLKTTNLPYINNQKIKFKLSIIRILK